MKKKSTTADNLKHQEDHKTSNLSQIILGGQDGLVNTLGVILGVAAASSDTRIVLAGGLAATFAESISMAAVAYTSSVADRDYYLSQVEKEKREMVEVPEVEREEIREVYRQKGFKGELLEKVVEVITSNDKVWLDTMMTEELKMSPVEEGHPLSSALIVGVSAFLGSLIPLLPFFLLSIKNGIYVAMIVSAIALFIVGAIKAHLTVGKWGKSGLEMAVIGIVSSLAGYGIGLLFSV